MDEESQKSKNTAHDEMTRRCPRLGGPVQFSYCRTAGENGGFCFKTADCWWEYFDISAYLKAELPPEELEKLLKARPKPKALSIFEIIEQAKKKAEEDDGAAS